MQRTLVVIPARMQSTRLPNKPLADIHGVPMIVHVWRRAMAAETGRVVVATDAPEIMAAIAAAGGEAVMTRADHASGSDRVFEAVNKIDPEGDFDIILNLQGDLPTLEARPGARLPGAPARQGPAHRHHRRGDHRPGRAHQPQRREGGRHTHRRAAPSARPAVHARHRSLWRWPALPSHRHLCVSPLRARALRRAAAIPLEKRERLEQLRALEDGMRIDVTLVDTVPLGVDTPDDLERARRLLA